MKIFNNIKRNSLFAVALMAFGGLFLQSCEESAVQGCTDPDSLNYDALAEEDDGTCTYESDKFLGIYVGALDCPSFPTLSDDAVTVEITQGVYESRDSVKVTFSGATLPPLSLAGTIDGNDLSVEGSLSGIPYTFESNGVEIMVVMDVEADSDVTLSDDGTNLAGPFILVGKNSATGSTVIDTDCTYDGTKQ